MNLQDLMLISECIEITINSYESEIYKSTKERDHLMNEYDRLDKLTGHAPDSILESISNCDKRIESLKKESEKVEKLLKKFKTSDLSFM